MILGETAGREVRAIVKISHLTHPSCRRALASLESVGLTDNVRKIVEESLPQDLVANFQKFFDGNVKDTRALAVQAARRDNSLPGPIWN